MSSPHSHLSVFHLVSLCLTVLNMQNPIISNCPCTHCDSAASCHCVRRGIYHTGFSLMQGEGLQDDFEWRKLVVRFYSGLVNLGLGSGIRRLQRVLGEMKPQTVCPHLIDDQQSKC